MAEVFTSLQYIKLPSTFCTKHTLEQCTCAVGTGIRLALPIGTFPGSLKMQSSYPKGLSWAGKRLSRSCWLSSALQSAPPA